MLHLCLKCGFISSTTCVILYMHQHQRIGIYGPFRLLLALAAVHVKFIANHD